MVTTQGERLDICKEGFVFAQNSGKLVNRQKAPNSTRVSDRQQMDTYKNVSYKNFSYKEMSVMSMVQRGSVGDTALERIRKSKGVSPYRQNIEANIKKLAVEHGHDVKATEDEGFDLVQYLRCAVPCCGAEETCPVWKNHKNKSLPVVPHYHSHDPGCDASK